jgi:hypothetical protein
MYSKLELSNGLTINKRKMSGVKRGFAQENKSPA